MSLKIGLTGGIGSGKSIVAKIFKAIGIPVFVADDEAKKIINNNTKVKQKIVHLLGEGIYLKDGTIDRKKLANLIFNDNIVLKNINLIVHPEVHLVFEEWHKQQKTAYTLYEAAIIFETGFYKNMDFNILVVAEQKLRLKRVAERDNSSEKQVLERMAKQWPDEKKINLANTLINNNNNLLIPQVLEIDRKLKENGKIW